MKSWKTTTAGIIAALIAILGAVQVMMNGGSPDWPTVIAAVMAALGLIFARDAKVSSEDEGLKK